jgi:hypothetical protein
MGRTDEKVHSKVHFLGISSLDSSRNRVQGCLFILMAFLGLSIDSETLIKFVSFTSLSLFLPLTSLSRENLLES